eukprot:TRINITY_DN2257_c0_g2_i1.p1 TRINITY_DN2257_c0_g2~~TRINITY_DN2257_c0_g2_i1.p1  ORF type:complete len:144 (+),score=31.22 TRINITY_DN2257_c0_g2_i1:81-512(+)
MARVPEGIYVIYTFSGKCLEIEDGNEDDGARLVQNSRNQQRWQLFDVIHRSERYYTLFPEHTQNKTLDVDGASTDNEAQIINYEFNGNDNQMFSFEADGHGYYHIISKHSGKVLEVAGDQDYAPIIQNERSDSNDQKFRLQLA